MDAPDNRSVAERLASELERDGEFVDVGGFDIDAGRALVKLQQFQLADPRAYVLRLAEAGLIAGASQLRFDFRGTTTEVQFLRHGDPIVLDQASLERLISVLVSRTPLPAGSPPRALLVQLAVAAVAILRLEPREFAIESVGADGRGHRQIYAPTARSEALVDAKPGTRIRVVEQRDVGRVLDSAVGTRREAELLRAHGCYAKTPIHIGHTPILQTQLLSRPVVAESVVDVRGLVVGEAGFVADSRKSAEVLLLSHGLLIESVVLPCMQGFRAVIEVSLPRDLSQCSFTRGPEFDAALAPVLAIHARLAPQMQKLAVSTASTPAKQGVDTGATTVFGLFVGVIVPVFAIALGLPWVFVVAPVFVVGTIVCIALSTRNESSRETDE